MKITEITHPEYLLYYDKWVKYRYTMLGGDDFIEKYVIQFSRVENADEFLLRKSITYCPAHAKAAILRLVNAIFQRMSDISRNGGSQSYQDAVLGKNGGVDRSGSTMSAFIGTVILREMLAMKRVGVYIDKPYMPDGLPKSETRDLTPYLYHYTAENIRSWHYNEQNQLMSLLLRDYVDDIDPETGLIKGVIERFRYLRKTIDGVQLTYYDKDGNAQGTQILNLQEIPFVMCEITESLLNDICGHQIALVNMVSSDLFYCIKSNFPFYTEQYNPQAELANLRTAASDSTGTAAGAQATQKEIKVGTTQGRRYPLGAERPQFINPSAEPLYASMERQINTVNEISMLLALNVANIRSVRASKAPYSEKTGQNEQGLEAGLSAIGMELQTCEQAIAKIWDMYEGQKSSVTISYPRSYNLRTDDERRKEAGDLIDLGQTVPSKTFQKVVAREAVRLLIGAIASIEEIQTINKEISAAEMMNIDPENIRQDLEAGLVGNELASQLRGYPKGEVEKAKADHADRAARIAKAQAESAPAARGVKDISVNTDASVEKK